MALVTPGAFRSLVMGLTGSVRLGTRQTGSWWVRQRPLSVATRIKSFFYVDESHRTHKFNPCPLSINTLKLESIWSANWRGSCQTPLIWTQYTLGDNRLIGAKPLRTPTLHIWSGCLTIRRLWNSVKIWWNVLHWMDFFSIMQAENWSAALWICPNGASYFTKSCVKCRLIVLIVTRWLHSTIDPSIIKRSDCFNIRTHVLSICRKIL